MTNLRLVCVWWEDSDEFGGWSIPRDWREHTSTEVVSVGFVVHETDQVLTVAPHYNDGKDVPEDEQGCGVMAIPRASILEIKELVMPKRQEVQSPKRKNQSMKQRLAISAAKARKRAARVPKKPGR